MLSWKCFSTFTVNKPSTKDFGPIGVLLNSRPIRAENMFRHLFRSLSRWPVSTWRRSAQFSSAVNQETFQVSGLFLVFNKMSSLSSSSPGATYCLQCRGEKPAVKWRTHELYAVSNSYSERQSILMLKLRYSLISSILLSSLVVWYQLEQLHR